METLFFKKTREIRKEKTDLEKKLNIIITIKGNSVSFEGSSINEYEALRVLEAMQTGFSAKKAILLLDEDIIFKKINIKNFTRRKDMDEVRSRIIGKDGKTKRTIEEISNCYINVEDDSTIGIIGPAESIEEATTAITNLIKGSKQANVYRFLEKINTIKKAQISDLGLKIKIK
jgi:ribosomal RNA assembly protein